MNKMKVKLAAKLGNCMDIVKDEKSFNPGSAAAVSIKT